MDEMLVTSRAKAPSLAGTAGEFAIAPCGIAPSSPSHSQRRRRRLIAPALGRPRNSSAAPDVRAPVVRGRWHIWVSFSPFQVGLPPVLDRLCLGIAGGCGYTLAA